MEEVELDIENVESEKAQENENLDESLAELEPVKQSVEGSVTEKRQVRLPLARIKNLMKLDPDCNIIAHDAILLVTKATEMFVEYISKKSVEQITHTKRKTLMKRDVDNVIETIPHLCFLDGALE